MFRVDWFIRFLFFPSFNTFFILAVVSDDEKKTTNNTKHKRSKRTEKYNYFISFRM